jgi:hypothetical protein
MSHPRSSNRKLANPSLWGVRGSLGCWSECSLARLIHLVLMIGICIGMSADASAKCGSSSRQMIWRNATNAELIKLERSFFAPEVASKTGVETPLVPQMTHDSDRPCSCCHCKDDKLPSIPLQSLASESNTNPICRFCEMPEAVLLPLLDSSIANLCDTFLSPTLGLLERPPRSMCL